MACDSSRKSVLQLYNISDKGEVYLNVQMNRLGI